MASDQYTRELKCPLTPDQWSRYAEEMARLEGQIGEIEERKKLHAAQCKAELDSVQDQIRVLARKLRERYEYRDVECREIRDDRTGRMTVVRLDTGDLIEERALTLKERQTELPLAEDQDQDQDPSGLDDAPPDEREGWPGEDSDDAEEASEAAAQPEQFDPATFAGEAAEAARERGEGDPDA